MTLDNRRKDKIRRYLRLVMVFIAVLLLLFAVVIPIGNNAVALSIENQLRSLSLPEDTEVIETTSMAGRITEGSRSMQYFGAMLVRSEQSLAELQTHFRAHGCSVYNQDCAAIAATEGALSFRHDDYDTSYYIVYRWGSAPTWLRGILNADMR